MARKERFACTVKGCSRDFGTDRGRKRHELSCKTAQEHNLLPNQIRYLIANHDWSDVRVVSEFDLDNQLYCITEENEIPDADIQIFLIAKEFKIASKATKFTLEANNVKRD